MAARTGTTSTPARPTRPRRLHDHAMTDALQEFIAGRKVVAIMGGHAMQRNAAAYLKVARLSRDLTRAGYLCASGGGPGGMEATHLGAWFAQRDDAELVDAVGLLSAAPHYDPPGPWMDAAAKVKQRYPLTDPDHGRSLGIPTWLYGHEPPTGFATDIAKYFANSVREEGLLAHAEPLPQLRHRQPDDLSGRAFLDPGKAGVPAAAKAGGRPRLRRAAKRHR